jgi:hypothetical protein
MASPLPSRADDAAPGRPAWRILSIEIGALDPAGESLPAGSGADPARIDRVTRWQAVALSVDAVARALASMQRRVLQDELAPAVLISVPRHPPRLCTPAHGAALVTRWRRGWQNCHVVVCELLMSGPLCVATGFVTGLEEGGTPSALSLQIAWKDRA